MIRPALYINDESHHHLQRRQIRLLDGFRGCRGRRDHRIWIWNGVAVHKRTHSKDIGFEIKKIKS